MVSMESEYQDRSDPLLLDLQRGLVRALAQWHEAAPDPSDPCSALSDDQKQKLRAAIDAEAAYDTRRRELGLF